MTQLSFGRPRYVTRENALGGLDVIDSERDVAVHCFSKNFREVAEQMAAEWNARGRERGDAG